MLERDFRVSVCECTSYLNGCHCVQVCLEIGRLGLWIGFCLTM